MHDTDDRSRGRRILGFARGSAGRPRNPEVRGFPKTGTGVVSVDESDPVCTCGGHGRCVYGRVERHQRDFCQPGRPGPPEAVRIPAFPHQVAGRHRILHRRVCLQDGLGRAGRQCRELRRGRYARADHIQPRGHRGNDQGRGNVRRRGVRVSRDRQAWAWASGGCIFRRPCTWTI